jgi:hypothetical protein
VSIKFLLTLKFNWGLWNPVQVFSSVSWYYFILIYTILVVNLSGHLYYTDIICIIPISFVLYRYHLYYTDIICIIPISFVLYRYHLYYTDIIWGSSWSCSYGSWIYNSLCNQYLSPLNLWARISFMASHTRYNIVW